jgi:hypothetical protein
MNILNKENYKKSPQDILIFSLGLLRSLLYMFFAILIYQMRNKISLNINVVFIFIFILISYSIFRIYRTFQNFKND